MERTRPQYEQLGGPAGGPGGIFDVPDATGGVTVTHGPFSEELPLAGETVAAVRQRYGDRFDLDPVSQAVIDGEEVDDDTVLGTGQHLMFMRRAGEKGAPGRDG